MCDAARCRRLRERAACWRGVRGGEETARTIERELDRECPNGAHVPRIKTNPTPYRLRLAWQ